MRNATVRNDKILIGIYVYQALIIFTVHLFLSTNDTKKARRITMVKKRKQKVSELSDSVKTVVCHQILLFSAI